MAAGRPTSYKKSFVEQAYKLCKLGATDVELADFFKVSERTLNTWKNKHAEFLQSIKAGKEIHDSEMIEGALKARAMGYTHDDVHISSYQGDVIETPIKKHYPPDVKAIEMWLTNRNPNRWKKVVNNEHSGGLKIKIVRES